MATIKMAIPIPIFSFILKEGTQGMRTKLIRGRDRATVTVLMSKATFGITASAALRCAREVLTERVALSLYVNRALPYMKTEQLGSEY